MYTEVRSKTELLLPASNWQVRSIGLVLRLQLPVIQLAAMFDRLTLLFSHVSASTTLYMCMCYFMNTLLWCSNGRRSTQAVARSHSSYLQTHW